MSSTQSASRSAIDDEVAVSDFQDVGSSTSTWADGSAMPRPAVVGDKASPTRSKRVVLAVTLGQRRWVMDVGGSLLGNAK